MQKNVRNQPMRWKRKDYLTVEKAIQDFNKKIRTLQKDVAKPYLPEEINLKDVRNTIVSRVELQRFLRSLREFKEKGAEERVDLEGGESITKWEQKLLQKQRNIMVARLKGELAELNVPTESGFSLAQMGNLRAQEIIDKIAQVENLEKKEGRAYERAKKSIQLQGKLDYNLRKAKIFKENYMRTMEKYASYDNYNVLRRKMESLSPLEFWNNVKDIELVADLTYQSEQYYAQDAFNAFVYEWGLIPDEESVIID